MEDNDLAFLGRLAKQAQEAGHDGHVNLSGASVLDLASLLLELLEQNEKIKQEIADLKGVKA